MVGQLHVRGVLSVPIRLTGQPMGTVDVYSTHPRTWSAHELEAMGEFATVAGKLVYTSVELASRELELAQLQQALTSRVWIEQAKGVLAATQGSDPEVAFQQLEARARAAEQALRAVQTDLARRRAALDQAQVTADERDRVAGERDRAAGHPD